MVKRTLVATAAGVDDPAVLTRPLRTAVERGHDAVVALLLGEGADAHSVVGGVTPMGLACANERMSTVRLLLKYGVDFSGLGPRGAWCVRRLAWKPS